MEVTTVLEISKRQDELYWPNSDIDRCYNWVNTELYSADQIIDSCKNKRSIIHAGANVGSYTLKFAENFETVYVFEPNMINFKCLSLNTLEKLNVYVFCSALGESANPVSLINDEITNCGTYRVNTAGKIPLLSVDSLNFCDVDCIHLDIEGYELFALKGSIETIKRSSPLIVIEWLDHGKKYGWNQQDVLDFLSNLGYKNMKPSGSDMMFMK